METLLFSYGKVQNEFSCFQPLYRTTFPILHLHATVCSFPTAADPC